MSDSINLLKNVASLDVSALQSGFTKVVINAGTDEEGNVISYSAGTDGGAVLTIENPWGSQTMANNMLAKIRGWQYQPYAASGALLDPAAELGDGVTIDEIYSGIFKRTLNFDALMSSEIGAPTTAEIEHEFLPAGETFTERAYSRLIKAVNTRITQNAGLIQLEAEARNAGDEAINSQLSVQAGQINAKVSKSGGTSSSFGWTLTDSSWELKSNSRTVLRADSSGLHIEGEITAKSGTIGGFDIQSNYISYGGMTWSGSASNGIYIGTSGIKLGQNFKVDTGGNVTIAGSLTVAGERITASNLYSGAYGGLSYSSSGWGNYSSGVIANCAYNGDDAYGVTHRGYTADSLSASTLVGGSCSFGSGGQPVRIRGYSVGFDSVHDTDGRTVRVLTW